MDWNSIRGLLWLLGIGALFYWMMRKGGCGMSSGHSHGGGHVHGGGGTLGSTDHARREEHEQEPVRDPVCGMQVDPERAAGTRTATGRTFYLCSKACLEKFDRDPEGYARRAVEHEPAIGGGGEGQRRHGCC